MGPWWLTWHLCLYICEKCEVSRLWCTDKQWNVVQYSVWAESAIDWWIFARPSKMEISASQTFQQSKSILPFVMTVRSSKTLGSSNYFWLSKSLLPCGMTFGSSKSILPVDIISIFIGTSLTMISFENSLGPYMSTMVSNIIKCKCGPYDDHHMINGKWPAKFSFRKI